MGNLEVELLPIGGGNGLASYPRFWALERTLTFLFVAMLQE